MFSTMRIVMTIWYVMELVWWWETRDFVGFDDTKSHSFRLISSVMDMMMIWTILCYGKRNAGYSCQLANPSAEGQM